ncbi:MAG: molybdopterin-dependent oxidoreductase [Nostoc sp.]|uniref:molybdopterin-dependent oxidoreductase n=1 Tax=Nostoc sp. TaxID=1180 RepID=UPI002FF5364A
MTQLVYNCFRLKNPTKRVSGNKGEPNSKFELISWDEALSTIARKFLRLRDVGEARAIAITIIVGRAWAIARVSAIFWFWAIATAPTRLVNKEIPRKLPSSL